MPIFANRSSVADIIAYRAGFTKAYIKAGDFTLMTFQKFIGHSDTIHVYIEGDGSAWENKHELSDDPTPRNPVALRLAVEDDSDIIAYIARPGQYPISGIPDCDAKYWSNARFAGEVIKSFNNAIDQLKAKSQSKHVELIGFSGGGAIAVLVAASRHDMVGLCTVAGNLDPKALCQYHHVSQLDGSLNPMDIAKQLSHIPQRHFVGSKDTVTPKFIARAFVRQEGDNTDDKITLVTGATHTKGWQERWKELLADTKF